MKISVEKEVNELWIKLFLLLDIKNNKLFGLSPL
jgi:hypothetical protein